MKAGSQEAPDRPPSVNLLFYPRSRPLGPRTLPEHAERQFRRESPCQRHRRIHQPRRELPGRVVAVSSPPAAGDRGDLLVRANRRRSGRRRRCPGGAAAGRSRGLSCRPAGLRCRPAGHRRAGFTYSSRWGPPCASSGCRRRSLADLLSAFVQDVVEDARPRRLCRPRRPARLLPAVGQSHRTAPAASVRNRRGGCAGRERLHLQRAATDQLLARPERRPAAWPLLPAGARTASSTGSIRCGPASWPSHPTRARCWPRKWPGPGASCWRARRSCGGCAGARAGSCGSSCKADCESWISIAARGFDSFQVRPRLRGWDCARRCCGAPFRCDNRAMTATHIRCTCVLPRKRPPRRRSEFTC